MENIFVVYLSMIYYCYHINGHMELKSKLHQGIRKSFARISSDEVMPEV